MPIPIVLCGRLEKVGSIVISELEPDYEVTYFVMSVEDGIRNLPLILSGSTPVNDKSSLGSKNYSALPKAVILGGGYDDEAITQLREAVTSSPGTIKIPWLKADPEKTKVGPTPGSEKYCRAAASRMKHILGTILEKGDLKSRDDETFYW
ncbi:hypothetical protein N7499_004453 [Penicillium canescens]|uniref:Uncharacterized protein n=1 Tax=Penicillium canescens TaxID=5083 RepID=A0AAD6IAF1_PENCN|nr:hypothetical protein N7522_005160 [Penicillium canescens]KAJ6038394.1 hypothetical protein N7460_008165 [Penicillium canescens]KAJ6039489.1 hypothetical protein N7444_008394 [Penicillium canescens]KAJ6084824.1 hypothetical protein N7499_004453 [Penicillium canescens]KAJ6161610.1 hypothetical protein N7485_009840 [Penicillium canescens]